MEKSIIEKTNKIIKGRSIYLIGMMASGKSKTGPVLAELLRYKYIDLDKLIENIAKKTINEMFREDGEKAFRELETNCLKETIKIPSLIVSTGGGIISKPENWGVLRQGIIIWIDTIKKGRFDDTNKMFVKPEKYDFHVTSQDAKNWALKILKEIK